MNELKVNDLQENMVAGTNGRYENKIPYEQGPDGGQVIFMLRCENIPLGTAVGFSSDEPGPQPPIDLPATMVNSWPSFVIGLRSDVPANYKCTITYYANFSQPPGPGAQISMQIAIPVE
jgi:hypothetical protein